MKLHINLFTVFLLNSKQFAKWINIDTETVDTVCYHILAGDFI